MRLSRSAWNNVIIFSVMGFILLINFTQNNNEDSLDSATAQQQTVIGENNVILTMTVDQQVMIERAGQSWTVRPQKLSPQLIEQMMRSWHQATGQVVSVEIDRQQVSGLSVSMVFAGQQNMQLFTLYLVEQQLIILNHQTGLYLALPQVMFNQLIPAGLLEE